MYSIAVPYYTRTCTNDIIRIDTNNNYLQKTVTGELQFTSCTFCLGKGTVCPGKLENPKQSGMEWNGSRSNVRQMLLFEFEVIQGDLWHRTHPSRENSCERAEQEMGLYSVCVVLVSELLPTHAVFEYFKCNGDRVPLLTVTALDAPHYDTKESLRGHNKQLWVLTAIVTCTCTYMNKCSLHGGFKWQTLVRTNGRATCSQSVYFIVVHGSCIESVDQVDTCCEIKYLSSLCTSMSVWNTDSGHWASYVTASYSSWDFLGPYSCCNNCSFLSHWVASSAMTRRLSFHHG